ncbi:MAG TPA: hypothetical protein VFW23_12600 [Tepidisphaeraceae bacterium]|nr:hypothetical protein [Tepidisphaeraceae bacterium]
MNDATREILRALSSENAETLETALLKIALALESLPRSGFGTPEGNEALYRSVLSPDEREGFSDDDVAEMIDALRPMALNSTCHLQTSAIWAIGKGAPALALPVLLEVTRMPPDRLDSQTQFQICISLHDCLERLSSTSRAEIRAIQHILQSHDPIPFFKSLLSSSDERVPDVADAAIDEVIRTLEDNSAE